MSEEANVTDTGTDDTSTGTDDQTAVETPATDPIVAGEKKSDAAADKGDDTAKEGEEAADDKEDEQKEFVPYDFDKDVKLKEGFDLPDHSKDALNEIGKEFGIPVDKIQLVVDKFTDVLEMNAKQLADAQDAHDKKTFAEWDDQVKKDFGDDLDKNKAIIAKAYDALPDDTGFKTWLEESGMDRHPAMAKAFLFFGKLLSEDSLHKGEDARGVVGNELTDIFPQPPVENAIPPT
jgi:hypothetical protein